MLLTLISFIAILAVILVTDLINILSPLVVFGVTWLVGRIATVQGWVVVMVIVPALSLLAAWLAEVMGATGLSFWAQFGINLVAVFVNEAIRQIGQANKTSTVK
ncbi:MAG: hypothetical protein IPJ03_22455 [Ignavibacteriales bacterium]|nr:hypothetical protein [Ignavibacteriales bacterium]MBK7381705.1 hypothetical protein [Ignavibacteriales bacterium]